MPHRETFPPPRPCVAISSIPVCDERQKLLIGGCAASRKAAARCVTKARSSPGRAAKIPSEAASLREKSFPLCRAKSPPSAWRKNPADRDTKALHHRRSKKVPAPCRRNSPRAVSETNAVRRRYAAKSLPAAFAAAFSKRNPSAGNRGGIRVFSSATCSCCDRRTGADQCRISSLCSSRCGSST